MTREELLQMEKLAALTPKEIEKQLPALFSKLGERAGISLKNTAVKKLKKAPRDIQERLSKLEFSSTRLGKDDVKTVLTESLTNGNGDNPRLRKEIEKVIANVPPLGKLDDILQPDVPLMVNPAFARDLMKAKVYRLSELSSISNTTIDKALVKDLSINTITEEKLDELVKDQILTEQEGRELGLTSNLYTLFDSSFELTEHVKKSTSLHNIEDLVSLRREDWTKLVKESGATLPNELKPEEYAEILYKKMEYLFPGETLAYRMSKVPSNDVVKGLDELKPLFNENEKVFGTAFEELKVGTLAGDALDRAKKTCESIDRISKVHPGLKLSEILNDKNLAATDKVKQLEGRIGLLDKFIKNNPEVDYLALSYTHDSEDIKNLNFQGFQPDEKAMVLNSVKTYQRVYSFTNDVEDTEAILAAGFHSSFHITSVTINDFAATTKLSLPAATRYFEAAHMAVVRTTGVMGSILDILTGSFDWTAVGNTGPSIKDYLRDIPGYQDLFGDLAYCQCDHCQSIYSPAAYFVDLMQFVEKYVINKHFTGTKASHVLNLKVRRPDLWSLPLTCENTSTLIPSLDIINEILQTYIAKKKGFSGNLSDINAVETFVFKGEIALERSGAWKDHVHSFRQPFQLPLESVSLYLSHFDKTREDISILLNKTQAEISKARIGLSQKEYELVTAPDNAAAFINRVYGIAFTLTAGKVTPFDAQQLLKSLKVSRDELGRIVKTTFATDNGADNIVIHSEKKDASSIQNDIERVKNLTYDALDRIHRFTRLWRKTGFTIEELDHLLVQIENAGGGAGIDPTSVTVLGNLLRLKHRLGVSVEELCAMVFSIPAKSLKENQKSLLDTLFNHVDVVVSEGTYPKDTTRLIHPSLIIDNSTSPGEFSSARLMAGLNRSDAEILLLIQSLAQPLGIVNLTSSTESDRGFNLTVQHLSLLYRHSKVAEVLKLSVSELFQLIQLVPSITNGYIQNSGDMNQLMDFHQWWKTTSFSIDDLHYIIESGGVAVPESYKSKSELADQLIEQVASANALNFADTIFAYFDDITEEQSKAIIGANGSVLEAAPDGRSYRLKPAFNPANAISVPAGITVPEIELRAVLNKYHPKALIPFYLSGPLSFAEPLLEKLISTLGIDLDADAYALELQGKTIPAVAIPALIEKLLPLTVLFKDKRIDADALNYIVDHPATFDITTLDSVGIQAVRKVHSFAGYLKKNNDGSTNFSTLADVVNAFAVATQYQSADQTKLSSVLNVDKTLLPSIHSIAGSQPDSITALNNLKKFADVCSYIGIGGEVLNDIVSLQYDTLNNASNALLGAFRSKYKTEAERKEKLEKYQDELRGKKRASLTTYLIHSGFPQFENENDLFHYFLIDTELEGCARTSRLVAATMSLQLYIHRTLLNLEQDDQEPGTPGRVYVKPDDIPGDEWDWRKNYRVWEANRKVFLYPENYIEPELRDDKSPLFEELETELLQQEINIDTVLEAYGKYMRGFDELGHLKIAGSYHEKDEATETDVVHLFGVTADEPPIYYYRRVENIYYAEKNPNRGVVWGPWRKISVQIPVRKVAPIVFNGRLHLFWVKLTTLANTVFDDNRSVFTGYSHKFSIEFTTLKLDNTWTPPQKLNLKNNYPFTGNGVVQDPLVEEAEIGALRNELGNVLRSFPFFDFSILNDEIRDLKTPRYDITPHYDPIDEYTLQGFMWDQVYPTIDSNRLVLAGAGYQMRSALDFYNLSMQNDGTQMWNVSGLDPAMETVVIADNTPGKIILKEGNSLFRATSPNTQLFDHYAYGSLLVNTRKNDNLLQRHWAECTLDNSFDNIKQEQIASLPSGTLVQIINGAYSDAVIDAQGDLLLLLGTPIDGNGFMLKRLGTTLSETLTRTLFTSGVDAMLSIQTQKALKEAPAPITISGTRIENKVVRDKIDFKGAYGSYYREIFFHIPFLIANHLNSQGKYGEAQKWYHYIFNPSATEVIDFSNPSLTAAQKKKMEIDRNWQYIEFRDIDKQKLREQLTDKQAIEVYKKDPFNPHAIARLRMSAYQKCIVMKYIDNLLDWGDQLFTMDTMESVNEATLLYIMAKEILGERPADIGDCGEGKLTPKTYERISPQLRNGSEFLVELENYTFERRPFKKVRGKGSRLAEPFAIYGTSKTVSKKMKSANGVSYKVASMGNTLVQHDQIKEFERRNRPEVTIKAIDNATTGAFAKGTLKTVEWRKDSIYVKDRFKLPSFGISIIRHVSPVFCVPGNKDLLGYYDRVDDRLYKIRNCMNIQGQKRQLALFAPEIDPRLLVRAKAAGLSMDDILDSISGNLPPYRFAYILERAKAFTSVVQGFGASLLGAIEKKSGEELNMLRMTQQQNILEMASKSRKLEIDSAAESISALNDKIATITYQISYYDALISARTNEWEVAQSIGRHGASIIRGTEATVCFAAGIASLFPQIGSPFAMKYGGVEVGGSLGKFAFAMSSLANLGENVAASAGLEAGFERRKEGWVYQKKLLESELQQAQRNLKISEIKRDILLEAEKIHQKNIEHNTEVMDFYGEKFSNLGLYTYLCTTMQRVFKEAYNNAMSIARLAEQAYRFERDDNTIFVDGNYFESPRGGLLAGERLAMALQNMERRYLETNYRKNEIDQAFSLTQINPAALLTLKQTGTCEFTIPEVFFDLFYPGQYRRKMQSVRLTIPCVTGPYTNVSATLSLMGSKIRMNPGLGAGELKDVPKSRTTTIATSTAQNDAGVFQLNFRDDRYMPFEGGGTISTWKLSLPRNFRQFDYNTINDIIIHVSYTAEYDELFRDKVEAQNDATEGTVLNVLKNNALARTFSFRQEFSTDFHRLTAQAVNQPVTLKIQNKHFPMFMNGKTLKVSKARLVLVTPAGQTVNGVDISVNGASQTGFTADPTLGNLFSKDLGSLFNSGIIKDHVVAVVSGGDLAPSSPPPGHVAAIDTTKLEDIVLYIEYKIG